MERPVPPGAINIPFTLRRGVNDLAWTALMFVSPFSYYFGGREVFVRLSSDGKG